MPWDTAEESTRRWINDNKAKDKNWSITEKDKHIKLFENRNKHLLKSNLEWYPQAWFTFCLIGYGSTILPNYVVASVLNTNTSFGYKTVKKIEHIIVQDPATTLRANIAAIEEEQKVIQSMLKDYEDGTDEVQRSWDEMWDKDGDSYIKLKTRCMELKKSIRQLLKNHNNSSMIN